MKIVLSIIIIFLLIAIISLVAYMKELQLENEELNKYKIKAVKREKNKKEKE